VAAPPMVVGEVGCQDPLQMPLVQNEHVVDALPGGCSRSIVRRRAAGPPRPFLIGNPQIWGRLMRRVVIAFCVGLMTVLGAGVAGAGILEGNCCRCICNSAAAFCVEGPVDEELTEQRCENACAGLGGGVRIEFKCVPDACSAFTDPSCPGAEKGAPVATPLGLAALLIALGAFGAWRLRKRAA
jgi:hypothetical protein